MSGNQDSGAVRIASVQASLINHRRRIEILEAQRYRAKGDWTDLIMDHNWVDAGYDSAPPGYLIDNEGFVHLRGSLTGGIAGASAFTNLPGGTSYAVYPMAGAGTTYAGNLEIDASSGFAYIYPLISDSVIGGSNNYQYTDNTFRWTGLGSQQAGFPVVPAASTLSSNKWPDVIYNNQNAVIPSNSITAGTSYLWALNTSGGLGWGLHGVGSLPIGYLQCGQRYDDIAQDKWTDQQATIEIVDVADLHKVGVGVRSFFPFVGGPIAQPVGIQFRIDPTAGGEAYILAYTYTNFGGIGVPVVLAGTGSSSPGLSNGDTISLVANGRYFTAFVNSTPLLNADCNGYAAGCPYFGIDTTANDVIVVTNFQYGIPDNDKWFAHPDNTLFLDGIVYEAYQP